MLHVVKSKDPKIPPRVQLDPSWRPPRDPETGALQAEGNLWDFIESIAKSRREGKNRRDGATVSSRVLKLVDVLGQRMFDDAQEGDSKVPSRLNKEEAEAVRKSQKKAAKRRRKLDARALL